MSAIKEILSERRFKAGYIVRKEIIDGSSWGGGDMEMTRAYNLNGDYIGTSVDAYRKARRFGIRSFEKIEDDHSVCSIGFSPEEQKWYGWSHRALYGFGIGSTVQKGDCAYKPVDKDDFLDDMVRFWEGDDHLYTTGRHGENIQEYYEVATDCPIPGTEPDRADEISFGETEYGVWIEWKYADTVPNEKIRGSITGSFSQYPAQYGKGEWTAETLEDAKQMAKDFSEGVS